MTVGEIKKFLIGETDGISFTDFAKSFITQMRNELRDKPANSYQTSVNSLKKYYGKENIMFSDITANDLRQWIETLKKTARAKQLYPVHIRKIFQTGYDKFNDFERNIIKITNQPFKNVDIPDADKPKKRFAEVELVRQIICTKPATLREELAVDVAKMVIYLAGINTVDLYNIEKQEFKNGKFCYNRTKEEAIRDDEAYFEITVPFEILPLIEKYKGKKNLLSFRERYYNADGFSTAVNKGLKSICKRENLQKITAYWLRHTWGTVARNQCGFSQADVAFGLNHASAHKVTEFYIEKDFSLVDKINEAVINYIFPQN